MLGRLRIRAKLILLVAVPLVAVVSLSVPVLFGRVDRAQRAAETARSVRVAGEIGGLIQDMQQERLLAVGYLLFQVDRSRMILQGAIVTDRIGTIRATEGEDLTPEVVSALNALRALDALRTLVLDRQANPDQVIAWFERLVVGLIDALRLDNDIDLGTSEGRQVVALDGVLRTDEQISSGAALLLVVVATRIQAIVARLGAKLANLQAPSSSLVAYATREQTALYGLVQQAFLSRVGQDFLIEYQINPMKAIAPLSVETLFPALDSFTGMGRFVERKIISDVAAKVAAQQRQETIGAGVVVGLSLLVLLAAMVLSVAVARTIARPLTRLTASADRVARLAESELQRVADEEGEVVEPARLEAVDIQGVDEISELAQAFERVQVTAAGLVERQAASRRNVAQMFGHVGRRTQNMVGLQLAMIDGLERNEVDADRLALLYRLDHLSSRLRRNAGSLVVLSGATNVDEDAAPLGPLPLIDVVRLALGEIEDYRRVDIDVPYDVVVAIPVTNDLVLVLAEVMENATIFSPPMTRVMVSATRVGTGVLLTIIDHGIGMSTERLAIENERLARRERLDLAPTEVLGLFVVGRLTRRHQMGIALLPTPGGGVTVELALGPNLLAPDRIGASPPAVMSTVEGVAARVPAAREVPRPALPMIPIDTVALNLAGQVLSTGRPWNAFAPAPSPPVQPASGTDRPELRQRQPGAQLPEGVYPQQVEPYTPPPADPREARTFIEELESAHERAARDATLAPPIPAPARRVPGANLPAFGDPNGSRTAELAVPPPDPAEARELVELFESGIARALREVRPGLETGGRSE
ncbi:MAG TPA: ATP-binding protein [Micromonosporaceae bacterium]|nr:ATP-binding protein [Micromonosporaceae bacterium]